MKQQIAQIGCKPWTLNGLSDRLIVGHYENNYGSSVREFNAIRERLAEPDLGAARSHEVRALKHEELAAMASARLHELYFGNLGGDGTVLFTGSGDGTGLPKGIATAIEQQFGSVLAWQREFVALARALSGRSGWVVLSYGRQDGRLYNELLEGDSQSVIDAAPLLVLDMYAFLRNVDWTAVANWLKQATDRILPADRTPADGITVEELAADKPVVYCAYGVNVGCAVAGVLRERGFDARFLQGGLSAWLGIGGARTRPSESQLGAA
jgi:Fe-Mn family superoxide dismutase